jgi:hypothetical protein
MEVQALSPEVIEDTSSTEVRAIASSDIQDAFGSNIGIAKYIDSLLARILFLSVAEPI